jgi:uncharacterized Fe-S cluster-containing radical SAM superfamily protein
MTCALRCDVCYNVRENKWSRRGGNLPGPDPQKRLVPMDERTLARFMPGAVPPRSLSEACKR